MVTTRAGLTSDGAVVTIAPGDVLELALPENPTTGYRWALDPLPAGATLLDDRMERSDPAPDPGAGATRVFAIRVGGPAAFHAQLRREWEAAPIQDFTVHAAPA